MKVPDLVKIEGYDDLTPNVTYEFEGKIIKPRMAA